MKNSDRTRLGLTQRWVVKVGSALLTNDGQGLDVEAIACWVAELSLLRKAGVEIVLVSSGSVAEGMLSFGWTERPHHLHDLQAAAAVGQMGLIRTYEGEFQKHGLKTAQILLTHDDLSNRTRYLNARSTLGTLLDLDVVPIINENDVVATDEIRFGDNDSLAALVANLLEADLLVILTDQKGMFNKDPRKHADAEMFDVVSASDESLLAMAGTGGKLGRGGMYTKVCAAKLAARSGASTIVASGREVDVLSLIRQGASVGTLFLSSEEPITAHKQWLAGHLQSCGSLLLDEGAIKALLAQQCSLLPVGVRDVRGDFSRGELVICVDSDGNEVARGLANYSARDARKIIGKSSDLIESTLGFVDGPELIHRDNLVVV